MKITIKRSELLPCVQAALNATSKKPSVPVLGHVLLDATGSALTVTGTDLEVELAARADTGATEPGSTTLPARKLHDILKNLPEDAEVTISASDSKATLKAGKSRFSLTVLPAADFPVIAELENPDRMTLPQRSLHGLVEKTSAAQAVEDVRHYLNGTLLQVREDALYSVSTDGHRLSMAERHGSTDSPHERDVIVPRKAVAAMGRVIGERDEEATLEVNDRALRVRAGSRCLTTKLIDGKFPDYKAVVPEVEQPMARIETQVLRQAVTRAAIMSDEKIRTIRLALDEGTLRIEAKSGQEDAAEEVEMDYAGKPITLGMNASYLLDALSCIDTDYTLFASNDSNAACVVLEDAPDPHQRHVIMPVRA